MSETMTRPATADTAQDRRLEAITAEAFFHWASGQSQGPENLPATAAGLPEQDRNPLPRLDGLEVPEVSRPRTGRDTQKARKHPLTTSLRFLVMKTQASRSRLSAPICRPRVLG